MNYEPVALEGKVLIEKAIFDELRANYARTQIFAGIEESRQQIKEGKSISADKALERMRKKHGF